MISTFPLEEKKKKQEKESNSHQFEEMEEFDEEEEIRLTFDRSKISEKQEVNKRGIILILLIFFGAILIDIIFNVLVLVLYSELGINFYRFM